MGTTLQVLAAVCVLVGCADANAPKERKGNQVALTPPGLPCALDAVLRQKCQPCHSHPPKNNAPIELLTWDDTQLEFKGEPVYQLMGEAVSVGLMPLDPYSLEPDEKQTILDWVEAGAPSNPDACPE